jgi:hypothetical protein
MTILRTAPIRPQTEADKLYAELIEAQRDLSPEASQRLVARLVLLLMNQIEDTAVIRAAIEAAARPR